MKYPMHPPHAITQSSEILYGYGYVISKKVEEISR